MEVGEYCRDIRGEILQIENIWLDDDRIGIKFKEYAGSNIFSKDALKSFKHSKNIIDLIEVGDYVNGEYVDGTFIHYESGNKEGHFVVWSERSLISTPKTFYRNEDIKSIVTKEQFNSIKYEVE